MPKKPLSVTLADENLLWLRGRAASTKRRSLSAALDDLISAARTGGRGADAARSVVGTIDISADDPALEQADTYVGAEFETSLSRPFLVKERFPKLPRPVRRAASGRRNRRG